MPYNETLANRIREQLADLHNMEEKEMMGGLAIMYNGKMCVGVIKDEMMCRIDPDIYEIAVEQHGCRPMDFTGKPMKGWVLLEESGIANQKDFEYWIGLALGFNKKAKASKKRKKKNEL